MSEKELETKKKDVLEATRKGNLDQVKILVRKCNLVKHSSQKYGCLKLQEAVGDNDHRDNPLHLAALHGHLHIVKYLIENGYIQSECRNRFQNTPLHRAARVGQLRVIMYLIEEQNCDPMCRCNWGRTPLHIACRHNHLEVVRYLTNLKRVDVTARDTRYRSTPLHMATGYGSVGLVRYLIEEEKCYNPANYKGSNTPLHFAAFRGNLPVVEYLVANKDFDVNVKGDKNGTPLHSACHAGHLEVVKYLMETGRIIEDYGEGKTPLEVAVEHGTLDIVKYMIDKIHFPLEFTSKEGYTLLHRAARSGKMDTVKYLIEIKDFQPDCKGMKGRTPLHSACLSGKYDIVEYLIHQLKVDPSVPDDDGSTPLHSAVKSGKQSVVEFLIIELGESELDVIDKHGRAAATIALQTGKENISRYIENVKEVSHDQLHNSLKKRSNGQKAIPTGEVVARGTFSSIIELKICPSGERVAGKVQEINPSDTRQMMTNLKKIMTNIKTIMTFSNKNIVGIKGLSFLPQRIMPVLLMEMMSINLQLYIKEHPFSKKTIEILIDIVSGLNYLHNLNPRFIHGHLTTDNVLLDSGLKAKIGGFAIASTSQRSLNTKYRPPDAQADSTLSDPSVDFFSFGHLALCTIIREEVRSLPPSQSINEAGKPIVRLEVDRRVSFMERAKEILSDKRPIIIFQAIKDCLSNLPSERPSARKLLKLLQEDGSEGEPPKDEDHIKDTSLSPIDKIGEEDRKLYEDAMKKGYIESACALLILLGVTGSGKSLFKLLVLGLEVPEFSPSTPLAQSTVRSMSVSTVAVDGVKWDTIHPQHMMDKVATEIRRLPSLKLISTKTTQFESNKCQKEPISEPSNGLEKKERKTSLAQLQQNSEVPTVSKQSQVVQQHTVVTDTAFASSKIFSAKFFKALEEITIDSDLMTNPSTTEPQKLMDINFVYLLDSGGQPPFREMLPHFVQQASAIVLTQKLNERLDFKPTIKYREEGAEVSKGYQSQLTNKEILYQYVQGVQSHNCKVFVVGTHRDREAECVDETKETKNKMLIDHFRSVLGKQMELYAVGNPDQLMFPVDSTSRRADDIKVAEEFRKKVTTNCMGKKEKIPLPWFVLEQLLQSLALKMGVKVLSIEECFKAAEKKLLMPKIDVQAALKYLGELNIIFYRPSILPRLVFPNAQVILDKITELVRLNHDLRTEDSSSSCGATSSFQLIELRECGKVNSGLLKYVFPSHYRENYFTSTEFLLLLEHLLIAGKLEDGEYFIPSLLPDLEVEKIAKYRVISPEQPAPLVVYYPKKWVPVGVMPSLVVYLQNSCNWALTDGKQIYHNCIQFKLPNGKAGSIVLIDSTKFLEIHVTQTLKVDQDLCTRIAQDVMAGLNEAHKSLHYESATAEIGFLCSGECGNEEVHLATLDPKKESWICSEHEETGKYLDLRQRQWDKIISKVSMAVGETMIVNETTSQSSSDGGRGPPTLPELLRLKVPQEVGAHYTTFGVLLLNDTIGSRVDAIENMYCRDGKRICCKILQEWLEGKGLQPVTWETLIKTLRDTGLSSLADQTAKL